MSRSGEEPMPDDVREAEASAPQRATETVGGRRFEASGKTLVPAKPISEPIFDVRDVSVYYGDHRAVRDVSMGISHQRITALIGPSGCGKSTFIRCLNR